MRHHFFRTNHPPKPSKHEYGGLANSHNEKAAPLFEGGAA